MHQNVSGEVLGYWGHEGPVSLVPGGYYVRINNSTSSPIIVQAGQTTNLVLGAIRVLSPEGQVTATDFYQASTGSRLGSYGYEGPVSLVPGTYYLRVNQSTSADITLQAGESKDYRLGVIHADGQFEIWDARGTRLGYYGDTMLVVPGVYRVKLTDGRTLENLLVEAGKITDVK